MLILGLTGGIASGKSMVSEYIKKLGIPVVDADVLSHQITQKGEIGSQLIMHEFGEKYFSNGELDRKMLAKDIFCSAEKTKMLNALLHPVIKNEIDKYIAAYNNKNVPIMVLEAPLLIESGIYSMCDKVLLITADKQIRINRAMKRSKLSYEEVCARVGKQMPDEQKKKLANFVIDNSGELKDTLANIDALINSLLETVEE